MALCKVSKPPHALPKRRRPHLFDEPQAACLTGWQANGRRGENQPKFASKFRSPGGERNARGQVNNEGKDETTEQARRVHTWRI